MKTTPNQQDIIHEGKWVEPEENGYRDEYGEWFEGVPVYPGRDEVVDEDPYPEMSNCCTAPFGYPGYPDNDICSACGEHADIGEEDENN